jgi:ESS family glutamate:Na+ symporter
MLPYFVQEYVASVLVQPPNAMANMSAVCYKYHYTVKPFLIVPIIGAMFADLINTGIISIFLNIL